MGWSDPKFLSSLQEVPILAGGPDYSVVQNGGRHSWIFDKIFAPTR